MGMVHAGRKIHIKMVFKVLHCKVIEFLQRVPVGRIINRFSADIDSVDRLIGPYLQSMNTYLLFTMMNIYTMVESSQSVIVIVSTIAFLLFSWLVRVNYIRAKRDVVRLQYISLSPVIGLCCSSVSGAPVIRSLKKEEYFSAKTRVLAEENSKNALSSFGLDAWYETRLALLNLILVFVP